MKLKMTQEPDDFEGVWPTEENGVTIDKLRQHLRLGGMVAAIADVRALMAAHDRLRAENERLRADAGRFQWLARADGCPFSELDDVWNVPGELAKRIDAAMARGEV